MGDRFPKSLALAAFTTLQLVAWGALFFSGSPVALYLSAAFLGMSNGGRTPIRVAILADYFGTGSLATILGLFGFFAGLIPFIFGPLAWGFDFFVVPSGGLLYETQGGFIGFLIPAGFTLLATILFLRAVPPQPTDSPGLGVVHG